MHVALATQTPGLKVSHTLVLTRRHIATRGTSGGFHGGHAASPFILAGLGAAPSSLSPLGARGRVHGPDVAYINPRTMQFRAPWP
jgi:hypothetical protein